MGGVQAEDNASDETEVGEDGLVAVSEREICVTKGCQWELYQGEVRLLQTLPVTLAWRTTRWCRNKSAEMTTNTVRWKHKWRCHNQWLVRDTPFAKWGGVGC